MKAIYFDTEDKREINVEYIFKNPITSEYCSLYGESVRWFDLDDAIEKIEDYLEKEHSLYLCEEVQEDGNRAAHLVFEDENENKYNVEVECIEGEYLLSDEERAEIEAEEQEQEEDYWEDYMTQTYFSRYW